MEQNEMTVSEKVLFSRLQQEQQISINLQIELENTLQKLEQYKEDNAKLEEQLQPQDNK
ncbi:hypothetical protein P3U62_08130 [Mammaliicoccus vitulinus]|uniref:hypothetical protein n=1 Tax=Mammaliicoccus vitulinus TaxID=71237 RepID=UPI002B25BC41|nr:hypothetical protein [Mammaliicoccus vitulinus]WQK87018.1 hypothetical protein P3U62_08130 [Mammaliicoccus vitulinus]